MRLRMHKTKNNDSSKKKQQIKNKIGKPPGTLIYVGESKIEKALITLVEYNETEFVVKKILSFDELEKVYNTNDDKIRWIDINGVGDVEFLTKLGELFKIHTLILEDIVNTNQQPKIEYYEDDIFWVMKKITWEENQDVSYDQISMLLTSKFLFTFRDDVKEDFSQIYLRIEAGKNVFRKSKADYLFYVLVDYEIDRYFLVLEEPDREELKNVQLLRKDAYKIKHAIRPVREALTSITRQESDFIAEQNLVYFRDSLDHVIQVNESLETMRESITTLIDIYLSSVSNRMNEVMKVLTIIATIFIPLTFIAGVYGMNFSNMPELHYKYGYFIVWGIMIVVGILLALYFKRKKWL